MKLTCDLCGVEVEGCLPGHSGLKHRKCSKKDENGHPRKNREGYEAKGKLRTAAPIIAQKVA